MDYFEPRDNLNEWFEEIDFDLCSADLSELGLTDEMSELKSFYKNANILISGGSGFMGKVLVEKILRSCDVGKIYLLLRQKKGKSIQERTQDQFKDELFTRLKIEKPNFLKKVQFVSADMEMENLGLSEEDKEFLIANTNIVIHAAATLTMDEHIRVAYNVNVRGTKIMLDMFEKMPNRKSFVYISTAYAHAHRTHIDELFYSTTWTEEELAIIINSTEDYDLGAISPKLYGTYTNSYSFSKALAEDVCKEYLNKGLPVGVVRPSIVVSTYREPIKAWINNIYGATGVIFGASLGIIHIFFADPNAKADLIPVDVACNAIITSLWSISQESVKCDELKHGEITDKVFNIVSSPQNPITWEDFQVFNENASKCFNIVSTKTIYHYSFELTKDPLYLYWKTIFTHVIPAIIVDFMLRFRDKKPILLNTQRKITNFLKHFHMYAEKDWVYTNNNVQNLWKKLSPEDQKSFFFNFDELDWTDFYNYYLKGLKTYILKEDSSEEILQKGRDRNQRQKIIHWCIKYVGRSLLTLIIGYPIISSFI